MKKAGPDLKVLDIRLSGANPIRISLHSYENKTSAAFDMHYPLEMGIILSGSMRRFYHDWENNISTGEAWFCGALEPHGFAVLEEGTKAAVLVINPMALAAVSFEEYPDFDWLAPFKVPPAQRPDKFQKERILSLAEEMLALAGRSDPCGRLRLRILLMEFLLLICDGWTQAGTTLPLSVGQDSSEIVYKALNMIFSSKKYIAVEDVAKHCGINRNSFSTLFRKFMGISFVEYALRFRLQQAAAELMNSCRTLEDIAAEWGFSDKSHFSNRFREVYGVSPNKYRTSRH